MTHKEKGQQIRTQILRDVVYHPNDISNHISTIFSITPQAVFRHIKVLEDEGKIITEGKGKGKRYFLGPVREYQRSFVINKELSEDTIWRNYFSFIFEGVSQNVIDICQYGFTEMVNNAIDHSEGTLLLIDVSRTKEDIIIYIVDNGEGIFKRIKRLCNLEDERHAIMELAKGKLTTDPGRHTGEGIFFTSRMFDKFDIVSKGLNFSHNDNHTFDFLFDSPVRMEESGTIIGLQISIHSQRRIKDVFDQYTEDVLQVGTSQFNKTIIPVKLAQYENEKLVSRSQAKRLLARIDKFQYVVFDFKDVSSIGQAFADEIFRVYANEHKETFIVPVNMNEEVNSMVNRALGI